MTEFADMELVEIRNDLAQMIGDPLQGFGCEDIDYGYDTTDDTADLAFSVHGRRYQLTLKRL